MKNLLLLLSLFIMACGSDSGDSDTDNSDNGSSALSIEETKEGLKNNSISFMDSMDSMNSCSQIDDLTSVLECMDIDEDDDRPSDQAKSKKNHFFTSFFLNLLNELAQYNLDNDVTKLNTALVDITTQRGTNDDSLLDDYNSERGTWVWNNSTKEFDKTTNGGNMKFLVDCGGDSVKLEIFDFDTGHFTEDQVEVPTRVQAELSYNNETYMTQNFSASVDDFKYLPNSLSNQTTLGCMGLNVSFQNNDNETFNASSSISIDDSVIFDMAMTANGNFYPIDNNGDDIDNDIDEILNSLFLSIKVVDAEIRLTGDISGKVVPGDDSTIQEQVDFLNDNTEVLILLNDAVAANGEFYVDQDTYEEYNFNTGQYETVTEDVLNLHLVFSDGSTQDLEVYFDDSFNVLEDKLDEILENFETTLGDVIDD